MTEDQTTRSKVADRVRSLFAKAASTEHEAEAHVFETKALELMAKYELEERDLRESGPMSPHSFEIRGWGNATKGVEFLYHEAAELVGAFSLAYSIGGRRDEDMVIMCTPTQAELISAIVDPLLPQLRADIFRHRPRSRQSYAIGWADTVSNRLREAQEVVYSNSNALVPTTHASREAMREAGHKWKLVQQQVKVHGTDYSNGIASGMVVDLGQHRVTD